MQWLIDIAREAMEQWIYDNGIYRYRGDPAAEDFDTVNFTRDGAWHDLDLSGIVDVNAKAVHLEIYYNCVNVSIDSKFRINGQANEFNISHLVTQIAGVPFATDIVVAIDSTGVIEYKINAAAWIFYQMTVRGWWL